MTNNMFGDIVTDLAAALQGGLGMAASGNIHPGKVSMFEPVHGSAPKYAGTGRANPFGAILTVALMLDHLGWRRGGGRPGERRPGLRPGALLHAGHRRDIDNGASRGCRRGEARPKAGG